jgi:hypothetical protein
MADSLYDVQAAAKAAAKVAARVGAKEAATGPSSYA